jgi:hypothetical protein
MNRAFHIPISISWRRLTINITKKFRKLPSLLEKAFCDRIELCLSWYRQTLTDVGTGDLGLSSRSKYALFTARFLSSIARRAVETRSFRRWSSLRASLDRSRRSLAFPTRATSERGTLQHGHGHPPRFRMPAIRTLGATAVSKAMAEQKGADFSG